MKLHWGWKIGIAYTVFVAGMLYLVVKSTRQKVDLVTSNYYGEEVKFQDHINAAGRAGRLSQPVTVQVQNGQVIISMPAEFSSREITGDVWFYCPADAARDKKMPFTISTGSIFSLPQQQLQPGTYIAKITWQAGGTEYYSEQRISI